MELCAVEPGVMSTQWKQEKKAQNQNNDCSSGFIGQYFRDLRFLWDVGHSLIFRIAIFKVLFIIYIDRAGLIFIVGLSHGVNFLGSVIDAGFMCDCPIFINSYLILFFGLF